MKKLNMLLLVSTLTAFALFATVRPIQAHISSHNWIDAMLKDENDSFLGLVSAGYKTGSTAILKVNVYNHLSDTMNITAVYVGFDWGINYSSTEVNLTELLIYRLAPGMSHVFTITFTVPDTTVASNIVKHSYTIYVEDVNAVGTNLGSNSPQGGSNFAVLSDEQADAIELRREINKYLSSYLFFTAKARELSLMAGGAKSMADNDYQKGRFSDAVSNYQEALSHYQDAWSSETESVLGFEKAFEDILTNGAGAITMVGWGYVIFGLGWVFIGIGIIIYAVRKPKAVSSS
ncbi:MAG: hypothetical protein K6T73_00825 [Candidatus Bathyarchaeota archaeon]|nr:hypothetical protein [Candidatus Bathyarchaeota archaeon]